MKTSELKKGDIQKITQNRWQVLGNFNQDIQGYEIEEFNTLNEALAFSNKLLGRVS